MYYIDSPLFAVRNELVYIKLASNSTLTLTFPHLYTVEYESL